jgi:hypothetical protein
MSRAAGMITSGTPLTLSGPPGATIYYTLDGSDPRALHGAVAGNARLYSGAITLTNNARVMARCRDLSHRNQTGGKNPVISSPWSGPISATFYTQLPPLIVTELMYHPARPALPAVTDADQFEFIELRNIDSTALNLVGFRFTNGIDFTFTATNAVTNLAPGGFVVLVKNFAAFALRYPNVTNIAGEFGGNLDNGGEGLFLEGPLGEPVAGLSYDDAWYPATDGNGASLVLVNETAMPSNYSTAAVWRASDVSNGSPGRADSPRRLTATRIGANVVLTWPSSLNAVVESTTKLSPPVLWQALPAALTNANGDWSITSPASGSRRFFRLQDP